MFLIFPTLIQIYRFRHKQILSITQLMISTVIMELEIALLIHHSLL